LKKGEVMEGGKLNKQSMSGRGEKRELESRKLRRKEGQ
jgi:hypothetical protein